MIRHIRHIYTLIASAAMGAAMLTGCSNEEIDAPRPSQTATPGTQLVINLAVPETMETASRAEGDDSDPTMPITGNEGKINSLRLIAFSADGTTVINRGLLIPEKMPVSPNKTAIYEIRDVKPGDYNIYLVANLEQYVTGIKTEQALKDVIINLDGQNQLAPGNLPMVYEPSGKVTIPSSATTNPAVATLSLQFACVKVKYDLLFDKAWNQDIFGNNGMVINNVTVDNVAKTSYLVINTSKHAETRNGDSGNGAHYNSYTYVPDNAGKHNLDVVTVSGDKADRPSAPTSKWAYEGILYLPERYATDKQTTINISATVTDPSGADGNVRCRYTIPLGAYQDDPDCKELPRGTYYEVIGKIKSLGDAELDATIIAKDWTEEKFSVDMIHTYLTVSKTEASVKSLEDDFITYDTDGRGDVKFKCETALPMSGTNRNPAIMAVFDTQAKRITFKVNPDVDITTLPADQQVGVAECYITAGNIRKLINVKYDIKPFFTITPLAVKIQWNTEYEGLMNTKIYEYATNLGGIRITTLGNRNSIKISRTTNGGTSTATNQVANSNLQLTFADGATYSQGRIQVRAMNNPGTTTIHYFGAYPEATGYDNLKQDLQVTVMPPLSDYRIYFRAINDYHHFNGGETDYTKDFLDNDYSKWPTEGSKNWNDWWHSDNSNSIENGSHQIYIYTQIGETTAGSSPDVWHFTGSNRDDLYNSSPSMTGDSSNPGWYYYDLSQNAQSYEDGNVKPEPGKTLMIFHAHKNGTLGYEPHRASHHLDPGIPLFDFEDREGYIIYDPTSEPYYKIFDDKPYIEDVVYTIYSKEQITGWWNKYGVAENIAATGTPPDSYKQWTIQYNNCAAQRTSVGNGWYKTTVTLKAPHGDYAKAIKMKGLPHRYEDRLQYFAPTLPPGRIRIYYCSTQWGNDIPNIYIFKDGGGEVTPWSKAPAMRLERISSGTKYYYYDVPSDYVYGKVIFQTQDRNGKYPTSGGLSIDNQNKIFRGSNNWNYIAVSSLPAPDNKRVDIGEPLLFDGREYPQNTGTFENGNWRPGSPF